ncbi:VOC family protein [Aliiglaciecola sp. 3_MG-2023]|uniref:VOC family protein n=1 Tax=Aliiglaciecola sp. 3_MG-2023 TaxID=3062644 RepID=UPI0026E2A53C|nr:VOC family protein [Aliiglaciecola sp. 3_MG-2023]MDO6694291.1 VOC family protein [Aliiglaciecola sp. 3_MG-2023]
MSKPVKQHIASVALLVENYAEAIEFYTEKLNFVITQDVDTGDSNRFVQISPSHSGDCHLLLLKAESEQDIAAVGNQAGGKVFLILQTDDFWRDYKKMQSKGVVFNEQPREEPYGTVVVFQDLYGNKLDLIESK